MVHRGEGDPPFRSRLAEFASGEISLGDEPGPIAVRFRPYRLCRVFCPPDAVKPLHVLHGTVLRSENRIRIIRVSLNSPIPTFGEPRLERFQEAIRLSELSQLSCDLQKYDQVQAGQVKPRILAVASQNLGELLLRPESHADTRPR